jgi:hypothetical protein
MTVITPFLVDVFSPELELRELHGHRVVGPPDPLYRSRRRSGLGLEAFLRPLPFEVVLGGAVGVPVLSDRELDLLFEGSERDDSGSPESPEWWEFWRTASGEYAMFPADDSPQPRMSVCLPVSEQGAVAFRVLDLDWRDHYPPWSARVASAPGRCVHAVEIDEPDVPYRGSCRNAGCPHVCTAQVVLHPEEGLYQLAGCACP